jgi:two-component system, NtrC family, sensor histidine kinase HydH
MNTAAITLLAIGAEPTEVDARAHALKNCVSVIVGLASTIERHVDPVARARAMHLVQASQRLKELVNPAPKSSSDGPRIGTMVSIESMLRIVSERLLPQAESASVHIEVGCGGGAIVGDFAELVEAVYNVAANALQASPPGGTVRITTCRDHDAGHEWTVEDAGCGIPANVLPRLGGTRFTTRVGGTGLGLSLAVQAVRRHGGVMRIESAEGRGTTVRIWLPGTVR